MKARENSVQIEFPDLEVETKAHVLLRRGPQFITSDLLHISSKGFRVSTHENWPIGALVDVEFSLADDVHPYLGEARVVRIIEGTSEGNGAGMALEFTKLNHERRDFSETLRQWNRIRHVAVQSALDAASYVRYQSRGNKEPEQERDFGEPGAGYRRPVLIIHGFLGTRGAMFLLEQRLKNLGFPVFSLPLGVLNVDDIKISAERIAERVEELSKRLGLSKINILAHSMGGLIALYYIKKLGGANRVRRLVTIGTPWGGAGAANLGLLIAPWLPLVMKSMEQIRPGSAFLSELHEMPLPEPVEYVSILARTDLIVHPRSCVLEGARNIMIATNHAGLVVSPKAFATIEHVLRGL